jgi:outer membrane lipopolysaccharide assembly protein LptE/RlpB
LFYKIKLYRFVIVLFGLLASCGYQFVGSAPLPFESITIDPVVNKTYEPRLEEVLHRALSEAFIEQGIQVVDEGGDYNLHSVIKEFRTISESEFRSDEIERGVVVEQRVTMFVNFILTGDGTRERYSRMENPYKFTHDASGSVQSTITQREADIRRVCREIALDLITRITLENVP